MKQYFRQIQRPQQKIKFEIKKMKELLFYKIGLFDKNLIVFDGGLGSQLLSYFQYEYLQRNGHKPKVNVEYFSVVENYVNDPNIIRRPWALDRYSISISMLTEQTFTTPNLNFKIPTNLLFKNNAFYYKKFRELDLSTKLPIDGRALSNFLRNYKVSKDYYAIHLRRGDFLTAASVIVSDSEILKLGNTLFSNIEKRPIFIFSDSKVRKTWTSDLEKIGFKQVILCGPGNSDLFVTHDLMRNAKILITSNSTFSLSAGLLARKDQLTIVPMKFYAGYRDEPVNSAINELSSFSILS